MKLAACILPMPKLMRFLLVFRSLLSEPLNEFGQFLLPILQTRYEKGGVFPPMLKLSEIRFKRAPIFSPILTLNREKP